MESRWKDKQRESSSSNRIMDSRIPIETLWDVSPRLPGVQI